MPQEWIALTAADGHELSGYVATPEGETAIEGGLVVVQEIFGVEDHIQAVCRRFAERGFAALAPALFDRAERNVALGHDEQGFKKGLELRAGVSHEQNTADLQASINYLSAHGSVGLVGYCYGGSMAWLAAQHCTGLAASVGYYGSQIGDMLDTPPRCPVMLHYGETDTAVPIDHAGLVTERYPTVLVHKYPAGHAFSNDSLANLYDEACAAQALERTLGFFTACF